MKIQLEDGRIKDAPLNEVTPQNYIVPVKEQHLYHCIIEITTFDSKSGKRISKPSLQTFGKKIYETVMKKQLSLQGYTVTVLYDPTKYLNELASQPSQAEVKQSYIKAKEDLDSTKAALERELAEIKALKEELKAQKEAKGGKDKSNKNN